MVRRHYSNAVTARLAMAGTRTIANWEDEVGVADAGYVRCGYLLTVPERLEPACRDNVARLQELGLADALPRVPTRSARSSRSSRSRASPARPTSPRAASPTPRRCAWPGSRRRPHAAFATGSAAPCARLRVEAGRVVGIETDRGFTAAGTVVLATGAWTNDLLRPIGAEQPIELRRLQVIVARRDPGEPLPSAVCSDAVSNVVVRPDRGRRFCAVAYAGEDPLERADDCDHAASAGYADVVRRSVGRALPAPGRLRGRARPSPGPYDITPDWNPIIGPCPGIEGLYLAVGWSGHGFKLSPAVGEVVAAEVTGRTPPIDVSDAAPRAVRRGAAAAAGLRAGRAGVGRPARQTGSLPCTTGETVILPPQGVMCDACVKWLKSFGGVTSRNDAAGHVWLPVGTSE